jgi:hypothetical protein
MPPELGDPLNAVETPLRSVVDAQPGGDGLEEEPFDTARPSQMTCGVRVQGVSFASAAASLIATQLSSYVASTCTNAPAGFRPFCLVPPGGTIPKSQVKGTFGVFEQRLRVRLQGSGPALAPRRTELRPRCDLTAGGRHDAGMLAIDLIRTDQTTHRQDCCLHSAGVETPRRSRPNIELESLPSRAGWFSRQ